MQSAEDFVKACVYPERAFVAAIQARDAEWQARVEELEVERARLLDEAAERGVAWLKTLHHEPEEGLPWSGKIRRMQDLQVRTLRAAIKGAE